MLTSMSKLRDAMLAMGGVGRTPTLAQAAVFATIADMAERSSNNEVIVKQSELAKIVGVQQATIAAILRLLSERKTKASNGLGYIDLVVNEADYRTRIVKITPKGKKTIDRVKKALQ